MIVCRTSWGKKFKVSLNTTEQLLPTSLLSGSKVTLKVGSSRWNRPIPFENWSRSVFFSGLIAREMTGSGTWIDSCRIIDTLLSYTNVLVNKYI